MLKLGFQLVLVSLTLIAIVHASEYRVVKATHSMPDRYAQCHYSPQLFALPSFDTSKLMVMAKTEKQRVWGPISFIIKSEGGWPYLQSDKVTIDHLQLSSCPDLQMQLVSY